MNITKNEYAIIEALCNSCYGDTPQDPIWQWEVSDNSGISGKSFSGVVSSLVKKNLCHVMDYEPGDPEGACIWLSVAGMKFAREEKLTDKEIVGA